MNKVLFLAVVLSLFFVGSVSALEFDIQNQTVQDNWTDGERNENPIVFDLNLSDGETFNSFTTTEENFPIQYEYNENQDTIEVVPEIENGTTASTYSEDYTIETNQNSSSGTYGIIVDERENVSFDLQLSSESIDLDSSGTMGYIIADNEGNFDTEVSYQTNDSTIVNNEGTFTVDQGETSETELFYRTGIDEELGKRNRSLEIQNESINFSYSVEDSVSPEIDSIEFPDSVQATSSAQLDVLGSDNTGIESVTAEVYREVEQEDGNETETVNQTVEEFDMAEVETGHFTQDIDSTGNTGTHYMDVVMEDVSGNTASETITFDITQLDVLRFNESIEGSVAQTEDNSVAEAFRIDEETEINITLEEFSYDRGVQQSRVRLVKPNGGETEFTSKGDTITVDQEGQYLVEISGDVEGEYTATFNFQPPEQHVNVGQLIMDGEFVDFVIPGEVNRNWPGADHLRCSINNLDRSNLNESRYVCEIPFKLTELGSSDERLIPVSPSQMDSEITGLEDELETTQEELRSQEFFGTLKNGAMVFMLISFVLYVKIRPNYIFMLR